jgi:hypothetical protein
LHRSQPGPLIFAVRHLALTLDAWASYFLRAA